MLYSVLLSLVAAQSLTPKLVINAFSLYNELKHTPFPQVLLADMLIQLMGSASPDGTSVSYPASGNLSVTIQKNGKKVTAVKLNLDPQRRLMKAEADKLICAEVKVLLNQATGSTVLGDMLRLKKTLSLYKQLVDQCNSGNSLLDDTNWLNSAIGLAGEIKGVYLNRMWKRYARIYANLSSWNGAPTQDTQLISWVSLSDRYNRLLTQMDVPLKLPQESMLGEGFFGKVFKTNREGFGEIALKMIKLKRVEQSKELITEIEGLRAVWGDPHFASLYYVEMASLDTVILTMEYLKGSDGEKFFNRLHERGVIPPPSILSTIIRHLLLGLQTLHGKKLIHTDLKPANMYITDEGRVKILDLGLVRHLDNAEELAYKMTDRRFAGPELFDSKCSFSEASDVWTVATTLVSLFANHTMSSTIDLNSHPSEQKKALQAVDSTLKKFKRGSRSRTMGRLLYNFVERCFKMKQSERPTIAVLLQDPFVTGGSTDDVFRSWVQAFRTLTHKYDAANDRMVLRGTPVEDERVTEEREGCIMC